MTAIEKIVASIEKLHGGEREQRAKHADFTSFLARVKTHPGEKFITTMPHRESVNDR